MLILKKNLLSEVMFISWISIWFRTTFCISIRTHFRRELGLAFNHAFGLKAPGSEISSYSLGCALCSRENQPLFTAKLLPKRRYSSEIHFTYTFSGIAEWDTNISKHANMYFVNWDEGNKVRMSTAKTLHFLQYWLININCHKTEN